MLNSHHILVVLTSTHIMLFCVKYGKLSHNYLFYFTFSCAMSMYLNHLSLSTSVTLISLPNKIQGQWQATHLLSRSNSMGKINVFSIMRNLHIIWYDTNFTASSPYCSKLGVKQADIDFNIPQNSLVIALLFPGFICTLCEQQKLRSDCMYVQSDWSLCWPSISWGRAKYVMRQVFSLCLWGQKMSSVF